MIHTELVFTGKELARAGANLALDHANDMRLGWGDDADDQLSAFLRTYPNREFLAEEVREFAYARGLPKPPNERAWGGVMMRAKAYGLIRWAGTKAVKNRKAHAANAALWVGVM